jgi:hypothetical protein
MNKEKIEGYLINLGLSFENVEDNSWLINDGEKGLEQILVLLEEPLLIIRVKIMTAPGKDKEKFFQQLLELNAQDLLHGAYALDGEDVILIDTLLSETLDLEEFQTSLDGIGLALAEHYPILSKYREE